MDVFVAGVGMTTFGVHAERGNHDLAQWAIRDALDDAACSVPAVDAAFYATVGHGFLQGQEMVSGQIALRAMGFERIPVYNVENACASGASALSLAVAHVRAGEADVALAVGAEKMHVSHPQRTLALFDGAYDTSDPAALTRALEQIGGAPKDTAVGRRSVFMDIYAALARNHMRLYGTTVEQIAAVAAKNHSHAVDNPRAFYRDAMRVKEVLATRRLSHPLTVAMCAPVTDGAAAVLVCNRDGLRRIGARPDVRVLASAVGIGSDRDITSFEGHITGQVARVAYERAGIGPEDVDVAEVHDATAFGEILQTEILGLVGPGEGGKAAASGETTLGGRIPVNPSGGLEAKGHPLGATGLAQVFELSVQLRDAAGSRQVPGARIGLAENGGGFLRGEEASASVIILEGR